MHTTSRTGAPRRALLAVMTAAIAWGTGGLAAQQLQARGGLGVEATACYRLLLGAPLLALVLPLTRGRRGDRPGGSTGSGVRGRVVVIGAGIGAYQLCYFMSIDRIGLAAATLATIGLTPVTVAVGRVALTGRGPTARTTAAIAVALAGLWFLVGSGVVGEHGSDGDAGELASGITFAVASASGYAVVALVRQSLPSQIDAVGLTAVALGIGAVVLLPFGLGDGLDTRVDPATIALLGYLGLVPTAAAYALYFRGLEQADATSAALATMLEPLTATLLAVSVGDESLPPSGALGAALLLGAIVIPLAPARGRVSG